MRTSLFKLFKSTYGVLAKTPLRRIPGIFAMSNVFFRLFWPNGNVVDVEGVKMYINVNDPNPSMRKTFQAYGMNLVHEEATTRLFKNVVKKGDVVLDLGANIGYFTLIASRLVGPTGSVFAFEPEPTNFRYLSRNVELNKFSNASVYRKAVSDKNGSVELYICDYDSGHHTINQYQGIEVYGRGKSTKKHAIQIESVRVDDFMSGKADKIDIIKMDVEGAEALAIKGMSGTLEKNEDIRLLVEFFPLLMTQMGSSPEAYVDELLGKFGFLIYAIGHDYDAGYSAQDLIPIASYDRLVSMLSNESDHLNLYLTRRAVSA